MKRRRPQPRIATKGTTSGGGGAVRSSDDVPLARASAPLGERDAVVQSGDGDDDAVADSNDSPVSTAAAPPSSQSADDGARAAAAIPPLDPSGDGDLAPCAGKVCFNCRTQKTPLWRNGPDGPKTLCNACGVRFKLGKLPPPGGFPPGHVIPKPPPRKRPAGKLVDAEGKVKKQRVGGDEANPNLTGARKKKRTIRLHNPNANGFHHNDENHGARFTAHGKLHAARSAEAMTEYDGAVLLMVLAGLYNQ